MFQYSGGYTIQDSPSRKCHHRPSEARMSYSRSLFAIALATCFTGMLPGCGEAPLESLSEPAANPPAPLLAAPPPEAPAPSPAAFVKDTDCRPCHEPVFTDWLGSDHERAMDHATPATVLGDFNNATFTLFEDQWRFFKEGEAFKVGYRAGSGEERVYPVEYTFGVKPLQQYLVPFPGGRYQCVPVAWDVDQGKWYHLYPDAPLREGDPLHWTGRLQNWNYMCAECHSTDLQKGFDNTTNTFKTTFSDINVGCQACHGPGSTHVEWAKLPVTTPKDTYAAMGLVVDYKSNKGAYQVDQCARCHARRAPARAEDDPARNFHDNFLLSVLGDGLYQPDGQIQDEVYEYGSFTQSKMYHAGVRCTDCHNPHNAKLLVPGNDLCARCHQDVPQPQFPTLKPGIFDAKSHHFHEPGTPGAQCVNCHMAEHTYMGIDERRDHSFRIPRPDLSVALGTPNACNACHKDKEAQWAADTIKGWYGEKTPEVTKHFANAIAAGRQGKPEAEAELAALSKSADTPAIVRATALELLQHYSGATASEALLAGLKGPSPLVRAQAVGGMDRLPPEARGEVLGPLAADPMASVRMDLARLLAPVKAGLSTETQSAVRPLEAEYTALQEAIGDQPEAHLNMALLYAAKGNVAAAEAAYKTAMARDPQFIPARVNLANLYNSQGRNSDAEHLLSEAIGLAPNEGELHYSMGLLLAEVGRLDEATVYMKRATELLPSRARIFYNYGLILQHQEQRAEAEAALMRAHAIDAGDGTVLQALVILYSQDERWEEAKPYAEKLLALDPSNLELQGWVAAMRAR